MIRPLAQDLDDELDPLRSIPDVDLKATTDVDSGKRTFVLTCGELAKTIEEDELVDFHQDPARRAQSLIGNAIDELRSAHLRPYSFLHARAD